MRPESIVIIGAGQAGGWAAQTLRKEGFSGRITLIGNEPHLPYERPPLSKSVLAGDAPIASTHLFKQSAFDELNLDWRPSAHVTAIDRQAKEVVISGSERPERVRYDKLILCTGGRARSLPVPGAELPGIYTLRNIADAQALSQALLPGKRLVVVGGGWIGLEVAATARKKGMDVTVVEAARRLCERTVPPEISDYLLRLHSTHGTDVILESGVTRFMLDATNCLNVALTSGQELVCDTVVIGVGMIPNDELAREAGLECDGGVLVDARCQTTDPDILAAGDVSSWHCSWADRRMRLESWQNAQEQGIAAARSALGHDVNHQPLPWFWSDQFDTNLQIYGIPAPSHRVVVRGDAASSSFIVFYLDGQRVKAALGPNSARDLRFARRLIENQKAVDPAMLADPGVAMSKV
jgi:3-phenylpropionate/trans-cinnamate dioxygenase ferredoxin reductase subunit